MNGSDHEEARQTCCTTTADILQRRGTPREGATITSHPLEHRRQYSSQSIPLPQTHIPRTDSELQLTQDQAIADSRDLCMLYRITNRICETQQSNLLPAYELLSRDNIEETSNTNSTEANRMVRSRHHHSAGLLIGGTSYASSHLESSSNCGSAHQERCFCQEALRESDCMNQEVDQAEETGEYEWSVCAFQDELQFPALLVSNNDNSRECNTNPVLVPGGEEEQHEDGCVFPKDL